MKDLITMYRPMTTYPYIGISAMVGVINPGAGTFIPVYADESTGTPFSLGSLYSDKKECADYVLASIEAMMFDLSRVKGDILKDYA